MLNHYISDTKQMQYFKNLEEVVSPKNPVEVEAIKEQELLEVQNKLHIRPKLPLRD